MNGSVQGVVGPTSEYRTYLGGLSFITAAAGTYTISIQFSNQRQHPCQGTHPAGRNARLLGPGAGTVKDLEGNQLDGGLP